MMRMVQLFLLVSALAAACVSSEEPTTALPATATTAVVGTTIPLPSTTTTVSSTPTTTTPSAMTTTTTTTTTTHASALSSLGLLVAHDHGIDLVSDHDTTQILPGEPTSIALADGRGGIVFQRNWIDRPFWDWDFDRKTMRLLWPEGMDPVPIEWIPSVGGPPQTLVPADRSTWIELVQVAELQGKTVVIYTRDQPWDARCEPYEITACYLETLRTVLVARDLDSDTEWMLGIVGGFEWGAGVALGGDKAAISFPFEPAIVSVVPAAALVSLGSDAFVDGSRSGFVRYEPCAERSACDRSVSRAVVSPDGSSVAFVEDDGDRRLLVVLEATSGSELARIPVTDEQWVRWIEFDGRFVLLGLVGGPSDGALVGDLDGRVRNLPPANHYGFWVLTEVHDP